MRLIRKACLFLFITCLFCSVQAHAHTFGRVIQDSYISIQQGKGLMHMKMQLDSGLLMLNPDPDRDGRLSMEEWDALIARIVERVSPNLSVHVDGQPVVLRHIPPGDFRVDPRGIDYGGLAELFFKWEMPGNATSFTVQDNNFGKPGPRDRLRFFLKGKGEPLTMVLQNHFWEVVVSRKALLVASNGTAVAGTDIAGTDIAGTAVAGTAVAGTAVAGTAVAGTAAEGTAAGETAKSPKDEQLSPLMAAIQSEADRMIGFFHQPDQGFLVIVLALGTAFILGAGHALTPGHGKAMVGAYLVGTQGRIVDAVVLGIVVTITHVGGVILLGLATLFLREYIDTQKLHPWLGAASGAGIFFIGWWMLARRIFALGHAHDHNHGHGHSHDHSHHHHHKHAHSFKDILSLGITGGMVPCPSAVVVLLAAIALGKVGFGLVMVTVFSLGLASVLIFIGILAVTASGFLNAFDAQRRWIQHLPVFSAGLVMLAGVFVAFSALVNAGILVVRL